MKVEGIREQPAPPPPLKEVTITFTPDEMKLLRAVVFHYGEGLVQSGASRGEWGGKQVKFCEGLYKGINATMGGQ